MAKLSKEEQARREGMSYALRVAREKGIDGLEEELKFRQAYDVPLKISQTELEHFAETIKQTIMDTVLLMSSYVLRDNFGFGTKRMNRFIWKFNEYTESLVGGYVKWKDIAEAMAAETGIEFHIRSDECEGQMSIYEFLDKEPEERKWNRIPDTFPKELGYRYDLQMKLVYADGTELITAATYNRLCFIIPGARKDETPVKKYWRYKENGTTDI